VTGLPLWEDEGRRLVHLGLGYLHRFRGEGERYAQRPEAHLAGRFVDTGPFDATDANVFDAELAWVEGPLSLQGEYTHSLVAGRAGQGDLAFWGAYGQASWFPTGEHRVYDQAAGGFGRLRPRASFDPARGTWGAFELALRYAYLDLSDRGLRGGKLSDVSAGVNWYLFPNARIMLDYVHAVLSDRESDADPDPMVFAPIHVSGHGDIVQTRFQVDF
jgi:phosphate-selective porin OprO/OprP